MHLTGLDLLLWAAGFFGHVLLLVVLFSRHRVGRFPIFTMLIANNVIRTIALYLVASYGSSHLYLIVYSSLAMIDLALQLGLVYELASYVFRPLGKWAPDVRVSSLWIVGISIAVASILTGLAANPPSTRLLKATLIRGNFFSSALMSELFVGMIALSAISGLPWKTHVAKISQGLGFYSLVCIVTAAGHTLLGMDHEGRIAEGLSHFRMITYMACLSYWIVMLWLDAPAPRELPEKMRQQLFTLQRTLEYDLRKLRAWRP